MKRITLILLLLILALSGWTAPKYKLLLVNQGNTPWPEGSDSGGYISFQEKVIADFMKKNPDIQVTVIARDITQGSLTVDALMAKGTPPDVWLDAGGYFKKYLNAGYALPMEKYMDLSNYQKDLLDIYTRDGHVYAVPNMNIATGMAVNLDMLKKIGYTLPALKNWTTDEFVRLSEKLKAVGLPSTMIMAQQGLITWDIVWLYAFGAQMYKNGDYNKMTLNSPEAIKGLEYMKMLVDKGYAWPYPNEVNDDMAVDLFTTGKVFSVMLQNGHTDYWVPEQLKQGKLDKEFALNFIEFPHAAGRDHTPVSGYQTVVVAHNSGNEGKNQAIAKLFETQVNRVYQDYAATNGGSFPTIIGMEPSNKGMAAKASYRAIAKLAPAAGIMDLGGMSESAAEVEAAAKLPFQDFIDGRLTAKQMLDQFEAEAKKILAR